MITSGVDPTLACLTTHTGRAVAYVALNHSLSSDPNDMQNKVKLNLQLVQNENHFKQCYTLDGALAVGSFRHLVVCV
jgi:hypothetical protein